MAFPVAMHPGFIFVLAKIFDDKLRIEFISPQDRQITSRLKHYSEEDKERRNAKHYFIF